MYNSYHHDWLTAGGPKDRNTDRTEDWLTDPVTIRAFILFYSIHDARRTSPANVAWLTDDWLICRTQYVYWVQADID